MTRQSDAFKRNFIFWKIFGIWPGKTESTIYKCWSYMFLFVTLYFYNILLIINLIYTPRTFEMIIRELIFLMIEMTDLSKVLMVTLMRKKIIEICETLDCEAFSADDDTGKEIINKNTKKYKFCYNLFYGWCHFTFSCQFIAPFFLYLIFDRKVTDLPVCKYYFLSDEIRDKYFTSLYFYQTIGMYGHMIYNINTDSFICGLIWWAVTQLQVLHNKLANLKLASIESEHCVTENQENILEEKLKQYLKHYELILRYCGRVQQMINVTIFVLFAVTSAIICVTLLTFIMPSSLTELKVFVVTYLLAITSEIFVPGWLGTQLTYESGALAYAAYSCEWIPRSEKFKRSLKLLIERANTKIVLKGLNMFSVSLGTCLSILKSAYSFFALLRRLQGREG